jgi:hypothetical protein
MASLPVLSSLTELLTGTVTDEFKKLIQPASLVAAAIFMALNLVLIFPLLVARRVAPAMAFAALPSGWQIALGTLTLAGLGYLISSLEGFFLSVLNGDAFRDSPLLYDWLQGRQRKAFGDLEKESKSGDTSKAARASYRLSFEFPRKSEGELELAPTRLGNILLSAASYTLCQYGAHLNTLWPVMDVILEAEDKELRSRLRESRGALTFLASLTVLLAAVAVELVVAGLVFTRPLYPVVGTPTALLAAYAVYRAALHKAQAWGREVRTAFDLYLDAVAKKLGLRERARHEFKVRRERWEGVSEWLAYGATFAELSAKQDKHWYVAPPVIPRVLHSPTISVDGRCELEEGTDSTSAGTRMTRWVKGHYRYYITNSERGKSAHGAGGAFLVVTDPRMPNVKQRVEGTLTPRGQEIVADWSSKTEPTLFWDLGYVPAVSSRVLDYTAFHDLVEVEVSAIKPDTNPSKLFTISSVAVIKRPPSVTEERGLMEVTVSNKEPSPCMVTVKVTLKYDKTLPSRCPWLRIAKGLPSRPPVHQKDGDEKWICWRFEVDGEKPFRLRFARNRT